MKTQHVEGTNEAEVVLSPEEVEAIEKARDIWAAVRSREEEARGSATSVWLVAGEKRTLLYGPLDLLKRV